MTNKSENLEDLNTSKCGTSFTQTRSPFLSSIVQPRISLNPISKRESHLMSPANKDPRDQISREKQALRSKSQVSFTLPTETTPVVGTNPEFVQRKQTFDAFLKSRDIELMLGEKNRILNSSGLERNISYDQIANLQSLPQYDIKHTLKKKEGKMFTNELWSAGYYKSVLHSSNLKTMHRHTSSLLIKPSSSKMMELENLSNNNTAQSPKPKKNSYLLNLTPGIDLNSSGQFREPQSGQLSLDSSPIVLYKGQTALKSILRNITPRKEQPQQKESSPYSGMNTKDILATDSSPTYMLSEFNRSFRLQKPNQRPQNLHISLDRKYEEEITNSTLDGLSPLNVVKSKKTLQGKYLASITSKFNEAKSPCGSKRSLLKNNRHDRSEDSEFLEMSSTLRHDHVQRSNSKSLHTSTEYIETRQKVQSLINQCKDLGEENKNLEKEVENTKADLEAFTNRRQLIKMQIKNKIELSETMQRKTNALRVLYRQKQGAS